MLNLHTLNITVLIKCKYIGFELKYRDVTEFCEYIQVFVIFKCAWCFYFLSGPFELAV